MKLLSINYIPGCEIEALGMVNGRHENSCGW